MFVYSEVKFNVYLGGQCTHLFAFKNKNIALNGFVKIRDQAILINKIDSIKWQKFNASEKITVYEYNGEKICSNTTPVACEFNGKSTYLVNKTNDSKGKTGYSAENAAILGQDFDTIDVNILNDLIEISETYKVPIEVLREILQNNSGKCNRLLYNNIPITILDSSIIFACDIANTDQEQKVFGQILLPEFNWQVGCAIEIFPFSYILQNTNLPNNVSKKYFFITFGGFIESLGLSLSIDIQYLIERFFNFLENNDEFANITVKDIKNTNIKKDLEKKVNDTTLKSALSAINKQNVVSWLQFFLCLFRIIRLNFMYQKAYYSIFFDFAMRKIGVSAHYSVYSKRNFLSLNY